MTPQELSRKVSAATAAFYAAHQELNAAMAATGDDPRASEVARCLHGASHALFAAEYLLCEAERQSRQYADECTPAVAP